MRLIQVKGALMARVLRWQRQTWQVHFAGREHLDRLCGTKRRFLVCFWHGNYVPIFSLLEGYEACVLSSQSMRGSVIAEICENFGYKSALIPDRPGRGSLKCMVEVLSEVHAVATAADGPLGPRHRVKNGVIRLASNFDFELLPVAVGSRKKIVLHKRWDRMELPLPFTRVCLAFGTPLKVPPKLRKGQIREWADHLADVITTLGDEAQKRADGYLDNDRGKIV
ncbi:DUF374 domain-containing protein [Desulforhopalus vacuolatus]|uniref:lysophospholipid acyltransferase family protein n=1 Tax=Desulforhopalus vacuolatus TaxID=40414 RepID=UPI0019669872|nr:DUF374 domain-containing protein [Desulforhopalus vacuolatus]MBM9519096.1 DUF374 domain-containing protein [Desulforhopalus vacuolatus]